MVEFTQTTALDEIACDDHGFWPEYLAAAAAAPFGCTVRCVRMYDSSDQPKGLTTPRHEPMTGIGTRELARQIALHVGANTRHADAMLGRGSSTRAYVAAIRSKLAIS